VKISNLSALPVGAHIGLAHGNGTDGFFERDGSSLLRADYPALFAIIGTTFGAADAAHIFLCLMIEVYSPGGGRTVDQRS
jgi:hypothetical protein